MRVGMLLLLVGCDRILGLDKVDPPVDAVIDAPGPIHQVSGRISQLFVHADAGANPILENVGYPPNAITLTYETDTETINLDTDTDGNFTFMPPMGTYRLSVTGSGDPVEHELVFSANTLNIQYPVFTRPDAVPVSNATIEADLPLADPVLFSMGVWEPQVPMSSQTQGMDATVAWPFAKLEAAKGDRVFAIEYLNAGNPPMNYINAVAPGSVTLMDGQTSFVMGPVVRYDVSPPGHGCMIIDPQFQAAYTRLDTPGSISEGLDHEWSVNAFPSDAIAPAGNGMPIAFDEISSDPTSALIENPFGLPLLAISSATSGRTYGTTSLTSGITESHEITVPTSGCPTETFDTIEAPVAISPVLAGTPIAADGAMIDRRGQALIDLTWEPAQAGTGWEIDLAEVGGSTLPALVHTIVTDQNIVKIKSSLLVPGHSYVFTFSSLAGLKHAANGDFQSASFPFAATAVVSHPFTVK